MEGQARNIVVTGDLCIDWLQWPVAARDEGLNWELYPGGRMLAMPGGALLLAEMVRIATGRPVLAPRLADLAAISPQEIMHSNAELAPFCEAKSKAKPVYRVQKFRGFTGPATGAPGLRPVLDDDPAAALVILDDAGNGFRARPDFWPLAIRDEQRRPLVIYKMSRPVAIGPLWDHLSRCHSERLVVVIAADNLRAGGVNISRRLSWERTAKDFVWQMVCNPALMALANCRHVIVRFGLEAAIYYQRTSDGVLSRLYFDPVQPEGGYETRCAGDMQGLASAFTAALAACLSDPAVDADSLGAAAGAGIRSGLRAGQRLLKLGYGAEMAALTFPDPQVFAPEGDYLADVLVPDPGAAEPADPTFWCILHDIKGAVLEDIAYDIVREGKTAAMKGVPVGQFGGLKTVDRAEIESFRSIHNLMQQYIDEPHVKRPLSLAVFGAPGSGKSFGVTEVAKSIGGDNVTKIEINLSQYRSPADLISAFHRVRDLALKGIIPLVFFDEFDSAFEGELGWLKYFLAPMQDGEFRDGEAVHPVGKAIFVFAGGTSSSFEIFCREHVPEHQRESAFEAFKKVKGPDFVSRLRGYVNIIGPNPRDDGDFAYIIRRAMLLRSMIERTARYLLDGKDRARIDDGVLRALIKVPLYKHGARSMEAILDMSMLNGRSSFEQACLPSREQLRLHVDDEIFSRLVVRDVLFGAVREILAQAIHEKFRKEQRGKRPDSDPSMQPWDDLDDGLKDSNRLQADDIPAKLRRVGCGFAPLAGGKAQEFTFTPAEVEVLAEIEHDRWVAERRLAGWVWGPSKDVARKISPYLVPWADLPQEPDDVQEWDRQAVRGMPAFLAQAKFEIYRLQ